MPFGRLSHIGLLALGLACAVPPAQSEAWDVTAPHGPIRDVSFVAERGTRMSLDVSPDGRTVMFDLLGHIYTMPMRGGEARSITQSSGQAINYQPAFSPTGDLVAFISDRSGRNALWVMKPDGSDARMIAGEGEHRFLDPVWTPDGLNIAVTHKDRFGVRLWLYPRTGGAGRLLYEADGLELGSPSFSPDGSQLYFHQLTEETDAAPNALAGAWMVYRLTLATGVVEPVLGAPGGIAPRLCEDGVSLAFARRLPGASLTYRGQSIAPRTAIWLKDLRTGDERIVADPVEFDFSEEGAHYQAGLLLPRYAWLPGCSGIVASQGGRPHVFARDGVRQPRRISFRAPVERQVVEPTQEAQPIDDGDVRARAILTPRLSPDGRTLAFHAFGRIWLKDLETGVQRRLTPDSFRHLEYAPSWSPDGREIAFASWDETERGAIWRVRSSGGAPQRVTRAAGDYMQPAWSADGHTLAFTRGLGRAQPGAHWYEHDSFEIVTISRGVERRRAIIDSARNMTWFPAALSADGRVYFGKPSDGSAALASVGADGEEVLHGVIPQANAFVISPDGAYIAYERARHIYVAPMPANGAEIVGERVSVQGGVAPQWRADGRLEFGFGPRHYLFDPAARATTETEIHITQPRGSLADGTLLVSNATIVTLDEAQPIVRGDLAVREGRILCIGACEDIQADHVIDAAGKWIVPGFIDTHHSGGFFEDAVGLHWGDMLTSLAHGVTTAYAPNAGPSVYAFAELVETGVAIGPRFFASGPSIRLHDPHEIQWTRIETLEDARNHLDGLQAWGSIGYKLQQHGRRHDRRAEQMLAVAARERGMRSTTHGEFGELETHLTAVLDGFSASQHFPAVGPIYDDFIQLIGRAEFTYNATLTVRDDAHFHAHGDLGEKVRRFLPTQMIDTVIARPYGPAPESNTMYGLMAQAIDDAIDAGATVSVGVETDVKGPSYVWELEAMASAMSPMRILESASLHGARALGMEADIGSLSVGKLADFLILSADPLADIRNVAALDYVVKGGVVHQAATLDRVWPDPRPLPPLSWGDARIARTDAADVTD